MEHRTKFGYRTRQNEWFVFVALVKLKMKRQGERGKVMANVDLVWMARESRGGGGSKVEFGQGGRKLIDGGILKV